METPTSFELNESLRAWRASFTSLPEFRDENVRELIVANHRLIYRVGAAVVHVIAFVHTARDLAAYVRQMPTN